MENMMRHNKNSKKKVCILNNDLARGGTDTFVVNLVNGLDKEKFDVVLILSINDDVTAIREDDVCKEYVKIVKTRSVNSGLKNKLIHFVKLYKILKSEKADVFQTNIDLFNGLNILVAWLARVPIRVCHSHNSEQGRELREGRTLPIAVYQSVMRWLCWHLSNRRTGCSSAAMDFLFGDRWKSDEHSLVVYNGINLNDFEKEIDINRKKDELSLKAKHNIITVGRIAFQKNPVFLAEIFGELSKERADCDLLWIGRGDKEEEVKAKLIEYDCLDRVHFLGTRSDVNEIMKVSDVFLFPSLFEGLGIVLIEAQASGLPCLITDTIPLEAQCGGCKYLSLNNNAVEWATELSKIIDKKIELKIDRDLVNNYSVKNMINQMESMFI